ncbi:hypothetical protein BGZ52_010281, partial [Haplosporangium bisporale]
VDALKVIETVYGYHAGMKYAQKLLEAALEQKIAKNSPVHHSFSLFSQTTLHSLPGSVLTSPKEPKSRRHTKSHERVPSSTQALFPHSNPAPESDRRVHGHGHGHGKSLSGDGGLNLDLPVKTIPLELPGSKSPAHAVVDVKQEKLMEDLGFMIVTSTPSIKTEKTDFLKEPKEPVSATKEVVQQEMGDEVEEGEVEGEDEDLEGGNAPVRITFQKAEPTVQPKETPVQHTERETSQASGSLAQGPDEDVEDMEDEDTVMEQSSVPKPRHAAAAPT